MLPVSLDCSCFITLWYSITFIVHVFIIALSVFYNIYLSCVLSTLCCQFLWIVHVLLPCQYSITFICPVSCLTFASFSGLLCFIALSVVYNIFVLCLVYSMLPVSLDCSCFITLSVSITFICPVSCLLYVASFSGLFMFYCPFGIL